MAEKQGVLANIIDPQWVLSEETGRLTYERLRCVSSRPKQIVLVMPVGDTVDEAFADRYRRILENRKARGIRG